jgi:hypothetical protein
MNECPETFINVMEETTMRRNLTLLVGAALLCLGVLGFVPRLSTVGADNQQMLFGIFMVGLFHNAFHVVSGIAGLLASTAERFARWYLRLFGSVYAVLAVLGLSTGIAGVNMADHILHALLAVLMLVAGTVVRGDHASLSGFGQNEVT